jgi:hypothetical protein
MRSAIWCGVFLNFLALGCGSQTSKPTAEDNSQRKNSTTAASDTPVPPNRDSNNTQAENGSNQGPAAVELDAIRLTAPAAWTRKANDSSFVVAEFSLPRADGDSADGRMTISTAGGSVEANIDRWKGQFKPQPKSITQENVDIAGLKATIVELSGDFNDQRGPFGPGELRPNYGMIAAVIPVGGQLHFIKATGPQKTIASHASAIQQFIRSATPTK